MSASGVIEAVDRFFLDLIGTLVPGAALIFGLWVIFDVSQSPTPTAALPPTSLFEWVLLALGGYVTGYAVGSIGENVTLRVLNLSIGNKKPIRWLLLNEKLFPGLTTDERELHESISNSTEYRTLVEQATSRYGFVRGDDEGTTAFHGWRNIAPSVAQESSHLVYRFMFISLFNLGIATVILILIAAWLLHGVPNLVSNTRVTSTIDLWVLLLMILAVPFFLERRFSFYDRAMRVPFSMAVVRVTMMKRGDNDEASE